MEMGASGGGALIKLGVDVDITVVGGGRGGAVVTAIGLFGQRFAGGCAAAKTWS